MSSLQSATEAEMDKTGIYVVSHKPLDSDTGVRKRDDPVVYDNPSFTYDNGVKSKKEPTTYDRPTGVSDAPYRGMGKEDLLRHSSKPLWRRLRYVCMSIILLGWLALIITVVALVLIYPRCRAPRQREWWQKTVVYRIYVPSFQDSNGDGVGDLNGIAKRLDYLSELGIGTISLSPIFQTRSNATTDFDVTDHTKIDIKYGTLSDFESLLNETHARGMQLTLDFIPNLTSDQHPWFQESKNTSSAKRNFYVWEATVPNNWQSVYGNSSWTNDSTRGENYLHQLRQDQPDLNLRSSEVKDELQAILQFWLEKGVDGFYIRDSGYLFEDYDLRDEAPSSANLTQDSNDYDYYNHTYTYGLREINDMLARWRHFLDDFGNKTNKYRMLFADIKGGTDLTMHYFGYFNRDGVDFPLNRFCLELKTGDDGNVVSGVASRWLDNLPTGRWANWMGGDENANRIADRLGGNMTRAFLVLSMLLPGTPFYYYGDEIGMVQSNEAPDNAWGQKQPMRAPMRWDNSTYGGFLNESQCIGKCDPWMKVNDFTGQNAVEIQKTSKSSLMHLFKNLTKLRNQASFEYGDHFRSVDDSSVVSFVREYDGEKGFLVAINFGSGTETRKYTDTHKTIPEEADVELTTENGVKLQVGNTASLTSLELGPYQGVVLSWEYVAKEL
ncbi:alpha-glucosidase-like isoform X1 [Haliotis cracherodii]|uniref:alpha-glucosidase-like isoform X1 n=2 Tax=Haliotis cracherodii TaxID=6455 RepID=UPI0039E8B75B